MERLEDELEALLLERINSRPAELMTEKFGSTSGPKPVAWPGEAPRRRET
jgi:hypothetical protein